MAIERPFPRRAAVVIRDMDQAGDPAHQGRLVIMQLAVRIGDLPQHFNQFDALVEIESLFYDAGESIQLVRIRHRLLAGGDQIFEMVEGMGGSDFMTMGNDSAFGMFETMGNDTVGEMAGDTMAGMFDAMGADHIGSIKKRLIDRTRRELQLARDREDPSSVLHLASRLKSICEDDSQALRMTRWALGHLKRTAEQLIESNQMSAALLKLARLAQEGEPVANRLQQLRERIAVPLRPRIVRGQVPVELQSSKVSILVAGIPTITIDKTPESRSPSFRFSEVGRRWTRSPAHNADLKRWYFLLDEIQQLTTLWLHARPQEAILLSARLSFHVSEALRISRRMAENSPRRSRVVWQEWAPVYSGDRWRIQATLPIWLIDQKGREIGQSIDVRLELSPSDPGRDGLPVTQAEIDRARQEVISSIDRELEKLASQIARSRLLGRLQEARALADRGDLVAAQELLVPALIGAQEQDQDLQEQATGELANWSQLGVTAVRAATGRSSSP